ncbi:hypothetical protein E2C01_033805 [Portunus trituberculatus]|uniref:Uncharacterized protein n=1 Tax=Portunus trituberculatus TaxID=210409 RepID=A0A5B7F4R6_PORTR|nr:hypothetical protein [Portunus trituberculatus]
MEDEEEEERRRKRRGDTHLRRDSRWVKRKGGEMERGTNGCRLVEWDSVSERQRKREREESREREREESREREREGSREREREGRHLLEW